MLWDSGSTGWHPLAEALLGASANLTLLALAGLSDAAVDVGGSSGVILLVGAASPTSTHDSSSDRMRRNNQPLLVW